MTRRIDCVDVSSMNAVDWTKIADHNITFGIVRFREFSTVAAQDDPRFREWWPAMRKAGLIRGAFLLLDPSPQCVARRPGEGGATLHRRHRIGRRPRARRSPLSVDYEQVGQNPPNVQACLNQLAWLLHPLETYLQTAMRRPDAKPIIYTGRNTWINVIQDHGAAFVTNDANAADRLTIDFSTYPLWWAWLANDALDPMNAAQMATIRSPVAWRATPPKSIILQYSGHVEIPGHEAEDGSVIAQIDAAGPITLSNDFTPLLSLARVRAADSRHRADARHRSVGPAARSGLQPAADRPGLLGRRVRGRRPAGIVRPLHDAPSARWARSQPCTPGKVLPTLRR